MSGRPSAPAVSSGHAGRASNLQRAWPGCRAGSRGLGKPDLGRPPAGYWLRAVDELGALPNVAAKLSVTVHGADDPPLPAEAAAPFVSHLLDCLGPDRLMVGSKLAGVGGRDRLPRVVSLPRELVGDDERIWSGTARRVYAIARTF